MKRKLFSAILFGALLTASTSGLTSCKDYDDDISNLQSQIDKLATADQLSAKVSEMQAAISAAQSAAESKAAAAQTVADAAKAAAGDAAAAAKAAQSTADAAAAAAAEVQKAADKAIADLEAKAATKADLEAAAQAAEAAVKKIQEAHATDKADIEKAIAEGLNAVKDEIAKTNEELAKLAARLDAVDEKLAALEAGEGQEEVLAAIQEEVEDISDALIEIIGEYTSMVTHVDLYAGSSSAFNKYDQTLKFVYVDQEKDTKFPAADGVADAQIEFSSKNKNVMTTDKLLVRVSPTNAVLNAANISLLNSQGADLSDYVEVKAVKPFEELAYGYTTRAAAEGNGLWEVEFKVKDGVDAAKFADAVSVKKGLTTYGIKYAVAVQNTDNDETRRVISGYGVEVLPEDYEPATTEIAVTNRDGNWWSISGIRNRYDFKKDNKPGDIRAENETVEDKANELAWKNEPGIAGGSEPTVQDKGDERYGNKLIDVEVGKSIDIFVGGEGSGSDYVYADNPKNETSDVVKGFYVVLDSDNAIESSPSEINAWESYSYTNVGVPGDSKRPAKLFYGNEGSISIDSPAALGDIIGFRVYVVNLDGTLVDPDGRAFYVNVATEKVVAKLTAEEVVAELNPVETGENTGIYNYHFDGTNLYGKADVTAEATKALTSGVADAWKVTSNASAYGNNVVDVVYGVDYTITFNDKKTVATVTILKPWKFLDDGTYTAQTTVKKANGTEICDLSVSFKKVLPEYAPVLAWGSTYDPTKQIFANVDNAGDKNIYKLAKGGNPQAIELSKWMQALNYGSGNTTDSWYTLNFANSKLDDKNNATKPTQVPTTAPKVEGPENVDDRTIVKCTPANVANYVFAPASDAAAKVIDGKSHAVSYEYNYGWISLTFNKQTAKYTMSDWNKPAKENLAMTFASWIHYEQVALAAAKTFTYTPGNANKSVGTLYLKGSAAGAGTPDVSWSVSNDVVVKVALNNNMWTYKKVGSTFFKYYRNIEKFAKKGSDTETIVNTASEEYLKSNGQPLEMDTNTTYIKVVEESGSTATEWIYLVSTPEYYKKISNGDYYRAVLVDNVFYYASDDAGTTKLLNQTEENVKANNTSTNVTKLADADWSQCYPVYVYTNITVPGTPGTSCDFVAWNTVISNYQDGKPVFGNAGTKVKLEELAEYLTVTKVETGANDPFEAALSPDKKSIVLKQKTGTLNPGNKGTLTITFEDCFGIKQSRTVEYNIAQ